MSQETDPYPRTPALTGFTWYQGEANTGSQGSADQYACREFEGIYDFSISIFPSHPCSPFSFISVFPSMITSWRTAFANPSAYFGFIQLSTWCVSPDFVAIPEMRVAQLAAADLTLVGYGVNADHGAGCKCVELCHSAMHIVLC